MRKEVNNEDKSDSDGSSGEEDSGLDQVVDADDSNLLGFNTNVDDFLELYNKQSQRAFSDFDLRDDIKDGKFVRDRRESSIARIFKPSNHNKLGHS